MGRAPCCDKNGLKKGPWTPEEDQKLLDYIQEHGHGRWRTLPKNAGLSRCGKSCRLRWSNYLRPDIKRGRFSFEEEETIIQLHSILGNKWSAIAARLPGRTDNEIKNYWNTHIRKRLLRMGIDPVTHSPRLDLLDLSSLLNPSLYSNPSQLDVSSLLGIEPVVNADLLRIATSLLISQRHNVDLIHQNKLREQQQQQLQQQQQQQQQLQQQQQQQLQQQQQNQQQFSDPTIQELLQPSFSSQQLPNLAQEISGCTTSRAPFMQKSVGQFDSGDQAALWQSSSLPCSLPMGQNSELYGVTQSMGDFDPMSVAALLFDLESNEAFNFPSALSTPASSPTPLNSSSTFINSATTTTTTEDERDSYCSNLFDFQMPDLVEVDGFM